MTLPTHPPIDTTHNENRDGKPWNGVFKEEDEVEGVGYVIAHYKEGRWHRDDDEPAYTRFDENGQVCEHRWIKNGLCTRANGPATVEYDDIGGKSREEWYNTDGELHSTNDHPAVIEYRYGTITRQAWYHRNELHRDGDTPAELIWDEDTGALTAAKYFQHGLRHRSSGPAELLTNTVECIRQEWWWKHGKLDRQDGPSGLEWDLIPPDEGGWIVDEASCKEGWYRDSTAYTPSAHDQLRWAATKARQGGSEWQEPEKPTETHRPGGVKAAAAAAKTKAAEPAKPKTADRGDER